MTGRERLLILAASDYFLEGTPYENIRAMAEAALEFGVYS